MRRICWLLLLVWLAGCSGGVSGPPPQVDAGPVPGVSDNNPAPTPPAPGPVGNPGGDPGNSLQAALSSSAPPGVPANPPPLVAGGSPRLDRSLQATYPLNAGWNVLSFPFARVTAASGFKYQLYGYSQGNFFAVDPVNNPGGVDTRLAFFAYADAATSVSVSGESNEGQLSTVSLNQGWNLIGCPSENQLAFLNMSASQPGLIRRLDQATDWISRTIYGLSSSGSLVADDLLGPGGLPPFQARWVYALVDADLNLNPVPPGNPPLVGNLSAASARAGDLLTLTGRGFGAPEDGQLTLGGVPVPGTAILSWSDSSIRFVVPSGARSGSVLVFVNRFPSNAGLLTILDSSAGTANLSGLVRSNTGTPLSGAQVTLDSGQSVLTGADGTFSISEIPAGDHLVFAQALGYKRGAGLLSFAAGDNRSLLVELSPLTGGGSSGGSGSEQARGNLYIVVAPYFEGSTRYFVNRIEVQEYGDHSNRWTEVNTQDFGDNSYDLTCDGAYIGRTYTIRIQWRNEASGRDVVGFFYRKFTQNGQTERFFNP